MAQDQDASSTAHPVTAKLHGEEHAARRLQNLGWTRGLQKPRSLCPPLQCRELLHRELLHCYIVNSLPLLPSHHIWPYLLLLSSGSDQVTLVPGFNVSSAMHEKVPIVHSPFVYEHVSRTVTWRQREYPLHAPGETLVSWCSRSP